MEAHQDTLQYAIRLAARGLLHAAFEQLCTFVAKHENEIPPDSVDWSLVHDEMGKIQVHWGQFAQAEQSFSRAIAYLENADLRAKCQIHLAMALFEQGDLDRSYRLLRELLTNTEGLSDFRLGILYNNLASVQWATGFYRDAANSMLACLEMFHRAGIQAYNGTLYTNIGTCYLEMREYDDANKYLHLALQDGPFDLLPLTLFGLSRLYFTTGDYEKSIEYAEQAVPVVGSIPMNFARYRIAYLSRFLAEMAYRVGDRRVAIQLLEKAELFFGMLERWTLWGETQSLLSQWMENKSPVPASSPVSHDGSLMMKRFLWLVDAMNAQELLSPKFPQLIDTRVEYALLLADAMELSHDQKENLAYAARLADYGLTALDPEVVENPDRSVQARMQYEKHPSLSVEMLQDLNLSAETYAAIASHHERRDDSGFGAGRARGGVSGGAGGAVGSDGFVGGGKGADGPTSACDARAGTGGADCVVSAILQIADEYATSVVWEGRTHSETMERLAARENAYDARAFAALVNLFKNP